MWFGGGDFTTDRERERERERERGKVIQNSMTFRLSLSSVAELFVLLHVCVVVVEH